MFEGMLENLQKQQEEMQQKLSTIIVEAESGDGAVKVEATANMRIDNLKIDASKLDITDLEQVEDLLLVAINRALELAASAADMEANKLMQGMMPPGGLGNLLKP